MCAGKRRRSNTVDPDAAAATGAAAAAAAAAYDQTPGGAAGAGFVPLQQQQVAISQQDVDSLQEAVRTNHKLTSTRQLLRAQEVQCMLHAACNMPQGQHLGPGHTGS